MLVRILSITLLTVMTATAATAPGSAAADSLWNAELRDEAWTAITAELARAEAEADTLAWIHALVTRGRFLKTTDDPTGAATLMRRAITLAHAQGDSSLACAPRRWLGVALTNLGRHEEALIQYRRLAVLAAAVGDTIHEAWAYVGLGSDADNHRDHPTALRRFTHAAELFEAAGDGEGALWANLGMANSRFHLGDYEGAGAGWDRVARIARREGYARHEAITRNNLAGLQFALGRPDVSLRQYALAMAVWDSLGHAFERMPPALNHAGCLAILGRVDEAREALARELQTCRDAGFTDFEARALRKLADLERDQGDPATAERLYAEALELGDERPVLERVDILLGLASLHSNRGDHASALASLDRAETLMADDLTSQPRLRLDLARAATLLQLGRGDEAAPLLARADAILGDARARHGMELELLRASLHETRGDMDGAIASLDAAASLWEQERSLPLDPDWREERGAAGRAVFARIGLALLKRDGPVAAFNRLQPAKARTLRERLLGPGVALADTVDPVPTAADLRSHVLAPDEVLLDAYAGADAGLLFALTRDECRTVTLPPTADLAADLAAWRDLLADPGATAETRRDLESSLRRDLFHGLEDLLAAAPTVILIPDGPLNLAPLGLLLDGDAEWTRAPSTAILRDLHLAHTGSPTPTSRSADMLVLTAEADGLAGATWQGHHLEDSFDDVTILRCPVPDPLPRATTLADHDVIHIAAHVRPDDVNAWQSAVRLGPRDDQVLRAVEVASMDLNADLVVLASCGSATGRVLSGEGVQGLASAFLAAGAPAVVASLWPVDDDLTALLMDRFYDRLADGASVADALTAARTAMRNDPATAHPFAWAGFVVIGDGETLVPIARKAGFTPEAWWGLAPLLLVGGVLLARRRR